MQAEITKRSHEITLMSLISITLYTVERRQYKIINSLDK